MTEEEILREMHGTIQRIDERTEMHTRQIGTIFSMMNDGGCSQGKQNATAIRWLWAVVCIGGVAIMGVIRFFHAG